MSAKSSRDTGLLPTCAAETVVSLVYEDLGFLYTHTFICISCSILIQILSVTEKQYVPSTRPLNTLHFLSVLIA